MRLMPTPRAASKMASTSACEKSLPHSPPNCHVPKPMMETFRFVLPRRRYCMFVSLGRGEEEHEPTEFDESPRMGRGERGERRVEANERYSLTDVIRRLRCATPRRSA